MQQWWQKSSNLSKTSRVRGLRWVCSYPCGWGCVSGDGNVGKTSFHTWYKRRASPLNAQSTKLMNDISFTDLSVSSMPQCVFFFYNAFWITKSKLEFAAVIQFRLGVDCQDSVATSSQCPIKEKKNDLEPSYGNFAGKTPQKIQIRKKCWQPIVLV